jgi:hypothetical protein
MNTRNQEAGGKISNPAAFERAMRRFDEANAEDPNKEMVEGRVRPRELVYAERLTEWVVRLAPDASEELRLAARSQHLCRWQIPRERYEMNRAGYHRWRNELKAFHAGKAGEILKEAGYSEPVIARVQELNLKKNLPADPEIQILEDALCLVFLQHQLPELASKTTEEKMLNALRKSWNKMSRHARAEALQLPLSARERELLERALA